VSLYADADERGGSGWSRRLDVRHHHDAFFADELTF